MDPAQVVDKLKQKISSSILPKDVFNKLENDLSRVELTLKTSGYTLEVDREISFINFVCELPWEKINQDILDLARARSILEKNHHGMEAVKERILEYLSVLILNQRKNQNPHSQILAFVGLAGSGKTTLAYSIAESLGKPIIRIPFGGLGSALQLRGESRLKPEAEPGLIIKALHKVSVKNPVILLDELDRVTTEARADIMGVLVELLDPEQNMAFLDHYLDIPFDLSQVLFIATANNLTNVATAVLDRLEVIEMPFYSDEQKIVIGRDYLLPKALKEDGLDESLVKIDALLWPQIVRPLGFDGGIRSLKRNIDSLVRKIALEVVEGKPGPFVVNQENVSKYLNKY
ncbi:AAA family ATPase [Candidatus Daviesbacteria bacterium]|nr:AAA family ATPase [Candidatus Daviesbacteria bacterium]